MCEFDLVALYETKSSTKYRKHCDITIIGGSSTPTGSFGALVATIVRGPTYRMKALISRLSSP
jgi:cytochrome bd-type quinol oxidase subunit 2